MTKNANANNISLSSDPHEHISNIRSSENSDLTSREKTVLERHQEVIAQLGQIALVEVDLNVLMDKIVRLVAETLEVEYTRILELSAEKNELQLRAGVGWRKGLVGAATVDTGLNSQAGYTLKTASKVPVIVEDLLNEERFIAPPLLLEHNIVSGISVIIGDPRDPFGELGAHSTKKRDFNFYDTQFLQAVAYILAAAIERNLTDRNQKVLLELAEKIRQAKSAENLIGKSSQIIRQNLEVSRCVFGEVDYENDCLIFYKQADDAKRKSDIERIKISDLNKRVIADLKAGLTVINTKTKSAKRTASIYEQIHLPRNTRSMIIVPFLRDGKWISLLVIAHSASRRWSKKERELIETAAERVWLMVEKLRNEAELSKSEERLRLILESVNDYAIFTIDNQTNIQSWNAGAEQIFGYKADEIIGRSVEVLIGSERRNKNALQKAMTAANKYGSINEEDWYLHKDGKYIYLNGSLSSLNKGKSGFVKIARDLTQQKISDEELRRTHEELESRVAERTRELEEANKILKSENKRRRKVEVQRSNLIKQLVTKLEEERRRIARDLHDHLGQQLTALRLNIKSLKSAVEDKAVLKNKIVETEQIAKQMDSDISFLSWQIRPSALDDLGLCDALIYYIEHWSQHFDIETKIHIGTFNDEQLSKETETNLYRIAQEILNNIVKHSQADHVSVVLKKNKGELLLIIEDNGIGFKTDKLVNKKKSLGLISLRERAALVGGTVEIESAPKKGTAIFISVPYG